MQFQEVLIRGVQIKNGMTLWVLTNNSCLELSLEPIFMLQWKVMKSITFNDLMTPSLPLFHDLQLLNLTDIHKLHIIKM